MTKVTLNNARVLASALISIGAFVVSANAMAQSAPSGTWTQTYPAKCAINTPASQQFQDGLENLTWLPYCLGGFTHNDNANCGDCYRQADSLEDFVKANPQVFAQYACVEDYTEDDWTILDAASITHPSMTCRNKSTHDTFVLTFGSETANSTDYNTITFCNAGKDAKPSEIASIVSKETQSTVEVIREPGQPTKVLGNAIMASLVQAQNEQALPDAPGFHGSYASGNVPHVGEFITTYDTEKGYPRIWYVDSLAMPHQLTKLYGVNFKFSVVQMQPGVNAAALIAFEKIAARFGPAAVDTVKIVSALIGGNHYTQAELFKNFDKYWTVGVKAAGITLMPPKFNAVPIGEISYNNTKLGLSAYAGTDRTFELQYRNPKYKYKVTFLDDGRSPMYSLGVPIHLKGMNGDLSGGNGYAFVPLTAPNAADVANTLGTNHAWYGRLNIDLGRKHSAPASRPDPPAANDTQNSFSITHPAIAPPKAPPIDPSQESSSRQGDFLADTPQTAGPN